MSITKLNPRTIHLAGPKVVVDHLTAGGAITPGMLVEIYGDSGVLKWRAHASATEQVSAAVALEESELNLGITNAYASGERVKAAYLAPGSVFYGIIPSGQNISKGALLQSNGDGKLKAASATTAAANVAKFQALDGPGSVLVDTRLRVQVIQ